MIDAQGMVGHTPETWNACFDAKNPDGLQWADRGSVGIFVADCLIADCHDKGGPNVAAAYGEANALPIPACVNALGASALS